MSSNIIDKHDGQIPVKKTIYIRKSLGLTSLMDFYTGLYDISIII